MPSLSPKKEIYAIIEALRKRGCRVQRAGRLHQIWAEFFPEGPRLLDDTQLKWVATQTLPEYYS